MYTSPKILSHHKLENIDFNKFFYTPRTLFTMCLIASIMYFAAFGGCEQLRDRFKPFFHDPNHEDVFEDIRFPVLFACLLVIGFAST
jgi:hypothetical protein